MTVGRNVIANFGGRLWSAVMNFAFVPVYIHVLGVEAYGLIGFFVSLMAIFLFLDMGLSLAINREMAQSDADAEATARAPDLMRTLETVYWCAGVAIGLTIILLAPAIGRDWLHPSEISLEDTISAVRLMGLVAILRWPVALYSGALMGLNRQMELNAVTSVYATVQAGGAALLISSVSPTIHAFFLWQILAAALQIFLLVRLAWRSLPESDRPAIFSVRLLRGVVAFSTGVTGITILSIILTQLDKFLLSRMLSLTQFGYYALAGTIAATLNIAAMAMNAAMFPAFSRLVAEDRLEELRTLYHRSAQLLSVIIIPAGFTLALFSRELLNAYVGNPAVVENTHLLLSYLVIGNVLLALMVLPLALQLANGWTRLSLVKNLIAVLLFVPSLWLAVSIHGALGAATVWIGLTASYVLIEIPVMHRRLLRGAQWRWYKYDVGLPALASLAVLVPARLLLPSGTSQLVAISSTVGAGAVALACTALTSPWLRAQVSTRIRRARNVW